MAIAASGIGSGLDINSIVSQLVAAEAEPVNSRLNTQETTFNSELSAYGSLKSALSTFQSSVEKLQKETTFQVFTANTSNEDVFTAKAGNTAVAGQYNIEVMQLAQAEKLRSADFSDESDKLGTGTLDISLGETSFQLNINSSNNTLTGIRDAINSALDNPGVSASLITVDSGTQLIFSADKEGTDNIINIVASDNDTSDAFDLTRLDTSALITLQAASDAVIKVDSQTVTRNSNSFSDVISGVTFNLVKAEPDTVETLSVVMDTQSTKRDIENFVTNYNTLVGVMRGLSNFDVSTGVSAPLNGDSVIRSIQNSLRQSLSSEVTGGAFSHLSSLGISIDDKGSLNIDNAVLSTKLASDMSDVKQFFSAENGKAQIFSNAISGFLAADGIIDSRSDGLQTRLDGIDGKREVLDRRMQALEARLNAQFTAMDILVAQLQSTGSFLTQQLANLPSPSSSSR